MDNSKESKQNVTKRLERAIGPVAAGLLLDGVDFLTFGPIGFVLGPIFGAVVGWYVSGLLCLSKKTRVIGTSLAALYCLIPFTEFIPIATLLGAFARYFEPPQNEKSKNNCKDSHLNSTKREEYTLNS